MAAEVWPIANLSAIKGLRSHALSSGQGRRVISVMRRICAFALLLAILLASGCDGGNDRVVLRVWDWWSPVEGEKMRDYFEEVERAYELSHPNVDIRFQHIPFGPQYIQKIMASMAAERPPDVHHASAIWANDLHERGVLSDLLPFVDQTPEMADVDVPRHELGVGIGDRDDRLSKSPSFVPVARQSDRCTRWIWPWVVVYER